MKLTKTILSATAAVLMAAGSLSAQNAAVPHVRMHRHGRAALASLGLSSDQQAQAKAIFEQARQDAAPVKAQLRQERQDIQAAIAAGKPADQIANLASAEGPQLAQLAAIHAASKARLYAILTPDQQAKLAALPGRAQRQQ